MTQAIHEKTETKSQTPVSQSSPESDFRWGSVAGLIVGLLILLVTMIIAKQHSLTGWQLDVFRAVNNLPNSLYVTAQLISNVLSNVIPIIVAIGVALVFKKWRLAWRFFVTIGGASLVTEIAKHLVKEPRPVGLIHNFHERVVDTGYGFPSTHTTIATAIALTLWFLLPRKWRFVSIIWIILVAGSRLYLGVHSPVDVVGAFGVGLAAVCFIRLLPPKISRPLRLDY